MPIYLLDERLAFPSPEDADPSGLLAVGGDLSPERLVLAYAHGIFPWFDDDREPILWHSPSPRAVLVPETLHVPKSLAKQLRRAPYALRLDTAFTDVVTRCARVRRPGQRGTWITKNMRAAYARLHELGVAHSAEAWDGARLVGGLYGVALGGVFFGESMFADADDASKLAFVTLVTQLVRWGFTLIDCQQTTAHLTRFGAEPWPRRRFLDALEAARALPGKPGRWQLDADLAGADASKGAAK